MPRDIRFWRNAAIVALAHLVLVIALARGSRESRSANSTSIIWMNAAPTESAAFKSSAPAEQESTPHPSPVASPPPEEKESPAPAASQSQIQLPSPTPVPTPTPKPTVTPRPTPKSSPKPTAKPTPKPTVPAKTTPKPSPRKQATPAEKKSEKPTDDTKVSVSKKPSDNASSPASDKSGTDGAQARNSEFAWYGTMLHDRFHKEWDQPKTVVATGIKMSATVRIRIEKDGRISRFTIVKPSGNVAVDESVAAVEKRVTQVDALPAGLIKGAFYEVQIIFELNPEQ